MSAKTSERISMFSTVALVACAIVMTYFTVSREFRARTAIRSSVSWEEFDGAIDLRAADHRRGSASSAVTIVEYADFECPACRMLSGALRETVEKRGGDVSIVYRHFPLPSHRFSRI